MKQVIVSGYMNPVHSGHISYIKEASKLGDCLVVILNNDLQVKIKGSVPFMNEKERFVIVSALRWVDDIIMSIDKDGSVCKTLEKIKKKYPDEELIFAKGGDKTIDNIPEAEICQKLGIKMIFGVGSEKVQSSSDLIRKFKTKEVKQKNGRYN